MSHDTNTTTTAPTSKHSVAEPTTSRPSVSPAVDIYENDREYLVLADLPGVAHDGVQIRFDGGELSLAATRQDDKAGDHLGSEIVVADYRRLFRIPETVDSEKIEAKLVDGVLHLVLPKSSKAGPRQISVKSN